MYVCEIEHYRACLVIHKVLDFCPRQSTGFSAAESIEFFSHRKLNVIALCLVHALHKIEPRIVLLPLEYECLFKKLFESVVYPCTNKCTPKRYSIARRLKRPWPMPQRHIAGENLEFTTAYFATFEGTKESISLICVCISCYPFFNGCPERPHIV